MAKTYNVNGWEIRVARLAVLGKDQWVMIKNGVVRYHRTLADAKKAAAADDARSGLGVI